MGHRGQKTLVSIIIARKLSELYRKRSKSNHFLFLGNNFVTDLIPSHVPYKYRLLENKDYERYAF